MTSIILETQEEEDKISSWFALNTGNMIPKTSLFLGRIFLKLLSLDFTELPIWTGGNRKAFDDRWFWATTGADITEFHWAENYPLQDTSEHACIYFTVPSLGWKDYLCEVPDAILPGIMCE
jgi:hypothetical protein